jgi:3-hydroxyisobutyrate dehydrogenase/2-hydroxy-3-oxopropionate reductase
MTRVAVLGLGAMGSRMATRLLAAGHELTVWNRTPQKGEALVQQGATAAHHPADAARSVDVVITMLTDGAALRDVAGGAEGVLAGGQAGLTWIEMSTVGPETISELASRLPTGIDLLDAPVLGSLAEAESGSLAIFVGGPKEMFERWTPLLQELGTPINVGGRGSGAAAKLVVNSVLFGVIGVLAEALALADGLGLTRAAAFEALGQTALAAQAERRRPAIERGEYPARFSLSLARKDADLIAAAADSARLDLGLAAAARRYLVDAERAGWGQRDYSAVLQWLLEGTP